MELDMKLQHTRKITANHDRRQNSLLTRIRDLCPARALFIHAYIYSFLSKQKTI